MSVASRRLYVIRVLKMSVPRKQLIDTYTSLVRSILEYCAPLFSSISARDSCRLERLQKRFHRSICGIDCKCDSFPSLEERRFMLSMNLLNIIMSSREHILHHLLPVRSSSGRFILPARRTTCRSNSFFPYACERFNLFVHKA